MILELFINMYVKIFFLLGPFLSTSLFLMMSKELTAIERRRAAIRTSVTILISIISFFFFGKTLFHLLGITLAAFQVGAGVVLFLTSVMVVIGIRKNNYALKEKTDDFAVVPLALPIIVGPGTIGTLLVWGTEIVNVQERVATVLAILCGGLTMTLFLVFAQGVERVLGNKAMDAMTKLTALILVAIAAQIILTGVKSFIFTPELL